MPEIKAICELFNSHFTGQCMPLVNNTQLSTRFTTHTDFFAEQNSNIIKKLDPNKAHITHIYYSLDEGFVQRTYL